MRAKTDPPRGGIKGAPIAGLDVAVGAAVANRLAKLEKESRELRELVLQLAASPGGLRF